MNRDFQHSNNRMFFTLDTCPSGNIANHQSHAKVYFFLRGREAMLLFGSANLTPDGWGIADARGCRPNVELLISQRVTPGDYRGLIQTGGESVHILPSKVSQKDPAERAKKFLNAIEVEVDYSYEKKELVYQLRLPKGTPSIKQSVRVVHDLIELRTRAPRDK